MCIAEFVKSSCGKPGNMMMRLAVKRLVEASLGKPVEKALDKESAGIFPFVWVLTLMSELAAAT